MRRFFTKYYFGSGFLLAIWLIVCEFPLSSMETGAASFKKQAPEWVISEWINTAGFTLEDLHGKVVIIDFFQLGCPGCNIFSIPLMEEWKQKYHNREDIRLIGIHTVFEGHSYQTPERLRQFVKEKNITYPVGIDAYVSSQKRPETMVRYQTRGTPEIVIIDKQGNIRFQNFGGFDPELGKNFIDTLLSEK